MIRFVLGVIIMIGALVFLGCPLRMVLRMSAGDLNAWVAFVGFILGVGTGVFALKNGFSLGRAHITNKSSGAVLPAVVVGILILATCTTLFKASQAGPGSMHAPIIASLVGGLVFGAFAQKSRMRFVVGFNTPGVIAHSEHLWNILGMYTVGFAAVLAGGCPLRQLILAGQGSSDSAVTVVGMFVGSAICHNFGLAASGTALNPETKEVVAGAVPVNGKVACIICIVICFIIAFTNKREEAK